MALENLDKSLSSVVDQLNQAITAQSADAISLAGQILQLNAQSKLAFVAASWWLVGALFGCCCLLGALSIWRTRNVKPSTEITYGEWSSVGSGTEASACFFGIAACIAFVVVLFLHLSATFDFTLQAAAKDPKIALARSILQKIESR